MLRSPRASRSGASSAWWVWGVRWCVHAQVVPPWLRTWRDCLPVCLVCVQEAPIKRVCGYDVPFPLIYEKVGQRLTAYCTGSAAVSTMPANKRVCVNMMCDVRQFYLPDEYKIFEGIKEVCA